MHNIKTTIIGHQRLSGGRFGWELVRRSGANYKTNVSSSLSLPLLVDDNDVILSQLPGRSDGREDIEVMYILKRSSLSSISCRIITMDQFDVDNITYGQ